MENKVTDEKVQQLIELWAKEKGEKLSVSKAKRKLQNMVDRGCPLAAHCKDCLKCFDGTCPALPLDGVEV